MQDTDTSILIVDDSKFNCVMIDKALKEAGYTNVRTTRSAKEGLSIMSERPVDILVSDWVMPEMDGIELMKNVREFDETHHHYTYILLLTSREGIDPMIEAFDQGVDDFLQKPPHKFELLARIYAARRISSLHNNLLHSSRALNRMNESLRGKIHTDFLTGFSNVDFFRSRLSELLKSAESRDGVLCLASMRLLNFQEVTQSVSQRVKDEVTISLARRLKQTVRPTDEIARVADNEYLISMYHYDRKKFHRYSLKRVSNAINLRPISTSAGFINIKALIRISCSDELPVDAKADDLILTCREKFNE
jgi:phosphoserine phosphatase RsbU/P